MNRRRALVGLLADGELRSGEALARELRVTRAAVAQQLRGLADWGLVVESVPRRGYQLPAPIDFVDAARLELALNASTRARLDRLEVVDELESTNARLLSEVALAPGQPVGVAVELVGAQVVEAARGGGDHAGARGHLVLVELGGEGREGGPGVF